MDEVWDCGFIQGNFVDEWGDNKWFDILRVRYLMFIYPK
jgi:hypothetical protein